MRLLALALGLVTLSACGDDATTDADSSVLDSGAPDGGEPPVLAELRASRSAWDALADEMGDTYSYSEENCVVNALEHLVTVVQVLDGAADAVDTVTITSDECVGSANRYETFVPKTVPELYDECADLVNREGTDVTVEFDDRDLIRACTWPGSDDCQDNCGEGFVLRSLTFGVVSIP